MSLTTQQEQVLALISAGSTISDAAAVTAVHRNTIHNWLRSVPEFRPALVLAREASALYWQEQAELYTREALDTIYQLMTSPKTPASTRLKAAQLILSFATNPKVPHALPSPESVYNVPNSAQSGAEGVSACDSLPEPDPEKVHNPAQSITQPEQQPYRRPTPRIGRNDLCPCGSGRKFKRCCVDKPCAVPPSALEAA